MHLSRGVRVGIHSPWISHLFFVDDCFVFSEASQRGASHLREILEIYSRRSGQLVNQEKSAIFFSNNCTDEMKEVVRNELNIQKESLAEKYLGLPTNVGRQIIDSFQFIPTKVKGLIGGWCGREASCAGTEILLKTVAQAVPTYSMSCFLLPVNTCKKMRTTIANYWWGSSADNRHIHWQSWDRLTQPKYKGGMGFRDLRLFNVAMLGKQGWRLITKPESLCARVLKGRYFHETNFMEATRKKHASQTWRAALAARDVLQHGLIKRISDGESTNIWRDRWLPKHITGKPITPGDGQELHRVSELMTASGQWNEDLIREIFFPIDAEAILQLPIRPRDGDVWAWEPERHGIYSVRSAYKLLDVGGERLRNGRTLQQSWNGHNTKICKRWN